MARMDAKMAAEAAGRKGAGPRPEATVETVCCSLTAVALGRPRAELRTVGMADELVVELDRGESERNVDESCAKPTAGVGV